jgi:hypothetical protein
MDVKAHNLSLDRRCGGAQTFLNFAPRYFGVPLKSPQKRFSFVLLFWRSVLTT